MRYTDPSLIDELAAHCALGTLQGPARRRFERLCQSNSEARAHLHRWEDHLASYASGVAPIAPADLTWFAIKRRLRVAAPTPSKRVRWWSVAAAAAIAAVALWMGRHVLQPAPLPTLAVLATNPAAPLWKIERSADSRRLAVHVVNPADYSTPRDYELWALPRGGKPVSLGVLPARGDHERVLSATQIAAIAQSDKVAVTIEAVGGSPTGQPTSNPIIVTDILRAG
jgi:anti-sigma-K factor RskA